VRERFVQVDGNLLRHSSGTSIHFVIGTRLDISSSRLREMVFEKQSIRYLVPPDIDNFITQKGLYQHE
jgi:nicotinate-nucleotide adenylyltransferase